MKNATDLNFLKTKNTETREHLYKDTQNIWGLDMRLDYSKETKDCR